MKALLNLIWLFRLKLARFLSLMVTRILPALTALMLCSTAQAQTTSEIYADVKVTNNPAASSQITVNGDTRTWTNSGSATTIATTNSVNNATTNLFAHFALYPPSGLTINRVTNDTVRFIGSLGGSMSVSFLSNWASVTYQTNLYTNQIPVSIPISAETLLTVRTNLASGLVDGIQTYSTQAWTETATALSNHINRGQSQTLGNKIITNSLINGGTISNVTAYVTNGLLTNIYMSTVTMTNGVNLGNAFRSQNPNYFFAEQYGYGATTSNSYTLAFGTLSFANGQRSMAGGYLAKSLAYADTALGHSATASGGYSLAVGYSTTASGSNSVVYGPLSVAAYEASGAIGYAVTAPAAYTIAYGSATQTNYFAGPLFSSDFRGSVNTLTNGVYYSPTFTNAKISGIITTVTNGYWLSGTLDSPISTNITARGMNNVEGDLALKQTVNTSLANGNNAAIPIGTNSYFRVSAGPTAAFTINGIANGRDGKVLVIYNSTAQNMTIAHESGVEPTAANRIRVSTGADITTTGEGSATLIYDNNASRWILISIQQ